MSKSRHYSNEEAPRQDESPSHKTRRLEQQRLNSLAHTSISWEEEDESDEFDTFEPIPKGKRRGL